MQATSLDSRLPIEHSNTELSGRAYRLTDCLLLMLMVAAAFLLGCQQLYDSDLWWHVRTGQWIWAQAKLPRLDPFTFASRDRLWIDLHWLFQLILALAFAVGGVSGAILMASGVGATTVLVGMTSADRQWPSWITAACWLPALIVMSARLAPRPEIFSLLGMAIYLAVLIRTDNTPVWIWILPLVQVIWVNLHGLFVLGPILLGAYLIDRLGSLMRRPILAERRAPAMDKRWAKHVGGAAVAVGLACLLNPYGLRGMLFPLELFPKITTWGQSYKSYIIEFMDLREYIRRQGPLNAAGNLYNRTQCFLLWVLPLSFIVPAICRAAHTSTRRTARASVMDTVTWLSAFGLAVSLVLMCVLGFPGQGTPRVLVQLGRFVPLGLVGFGTTGMLLLARSSCLAAFLAAVGGIAEALWIVWLKSYLLGTDLGFLTWLGASASALPILGWGTAFVGIAVCAMAIYAGGRLFRVILTVAFGYLTLQAIRNINLFGLVAGYVLACNLGQWAIELNAQWPLRRGLPYSNWLVGLAVRFAVAGLVGLMILAIISGRFFRATNETRQFGLSAAPLAYAHEAARFAGTPGLPKHAVVFSLRQAGVYIFHNGPDRKPFLDGRLELPSRAMFDTYVRLDQSLNQGRPGWAEALRQMGDPLILLDHDKNCGAEATLLPDPDWRCIYYDAIASVFVARHQRDLETSFPSIDFAARHFRDANWHRVVPKPWGQAEATAFINLESAIRLRPGVTWQLRFPLLLLASDRLRQSLALDPTSADQWSLLGTSYWNMVPDVALAPPGSDEPWDPLRGLMAAQAIFCYQQALSRDPGQIRALFSLFRAFQAMRMHDARRSVAILMRRAWAVAVGADADQPRYREREIDLMAASEIGNDDDQLPSLDSPDDLSGAVARLLWRGRPEAAIRLFVAAEARGIVGDWSVRDRIATTLLFLGRPLEAQRIWERTLNAPAPALQLARKATALFTMLDYPSAQKTYETALELDPHLSEAWLGLALLHTQRGEAVEALAAARTGQQQDLTPAQASLLAEVQSLIARLATPR